MYLVIGGGEFHAQERSRSVRGQLTSNLHPIQSQPDML
jgi:hypothetical protein